MTFVEAVYKNEVIIPEKYRRGLLPEDVDVTELIKLADGDIFYELVFDLHNTEKEKIFNAAKLAIIKMYVDAKEVIQDENRESGIIICKGISTDIVEVDRTSYNATYYNVVEIAIKDNKCRVRIINPNVSLIYYTYSYTAGMALPNTHNIPKAPLKDQLFLYRNLKSQRKIKKSDRHLMLKAVELLKSYHINATGLLYEFEAVVKDNLGKNDDDNW